jgi:pimeloyl-ACP methyl ester carboxylesterase
MGLVILLMSAGGLIIAVATVVVIHKVQRPGRKTYAVALGRGMPTEPRELNLDAEEQEFTFPDGSTSPGWVITGKCETGPAVVISHGWSDSRYGSLLRVPLLVPYASKIVIYDMRAHGESSASVCRLGTDEADDLFAVIEQALAPDTPVVLFGSSLGGGVSIVSAARANKAAQESGRHDSSIRLPSITGVIADGPYRHVLEPITGYMRYFKIYPYPIVWFAWAHLAFWKGGLLAFDRVIHAQEVSCPLMVLHGTRDCVSSYESGVAIAQAAKNGTLVRFDDGGHTDLAWSHSDRFKEALDSFFMGLDAAPQSPEEAINAEAPVA